MDFKLDGYYSSEMDIKKGKNYDVNDEYCKWYDVYLNIRNKYFNYNKTQESLLEFELREIYSVFNKCLNNELDHDEELNFIEPDLELLVYKSTDDNHSHLCDFRICMYLEDAGATGDYYSILISDEEMNMIKNKIQSLLENKKEIDTSTEPELNAEFNINDLPQEDDSQINNKYPNNTVILKHLGSWYKVNFDGVYIVSFLMDYKLFEDPRYGTPTVGFPDSSINRVVDLLRKNKINYMLKYDDDKIVDFGEENNFVKFLHNDSPFSYVTSRGEIKKPIKGSFVVQYENEEPETYTIGENINMETELVKKVVESNAGECIKVNDFNVKIIEKNIE